MDVTLAVLADAANVSQEGKLNILGSFSNIFAAAFPARHPEMQIILRLEASPAEAGSQKKLQIVLMDEDGKPLRDEPMEIAFETPPSKGTGQKIQVQLIVRVLDTTFAKEGRYSIAILINGETKDDIPLTVSRPSNTA